MGYAMCLSRRRMRTQSWCPQRRRGSSVSPLTHSMVRPTSTATSLLAPSSPCTRKKDGSVNDLLRSGADCICAGYCAYSSAVELVFTFQGGTVEGFCLDPTIGEFVHTRRNMTFPQDGGKRIYSCNEGNFNHWDQPIKDAVDAFKKGIDGKPYSARYVGSMVAGIHRTLLYGGIYIYPADKKSPKGKLRCLYEGIPMALIIEQAGKNPVCHCHVLQSQVTK